jgi:predicted metal-dependent hydrolase
MAAALPDPRLLEGLRLLQAREWYQAHEEIEDAWRDTPPGELRECLQGVIQLCVALEHLRRGNALGCHNVAGRARARLEALPPVVAGMRVHEWLAALETFFEAIGLAELSKRYRASQGFSDTTPPVTPPESEWPVLPLAPA